MNSRTFYTAILQCPGYYMKPFTKALKTMFEGSVIEIDDHYVWQTDDAKYSIVYDTRAEGIISRVVDVPVAAALATFQSQLVGSGICLREEEDRVLPLGHMQIGVYNVDPHRHLGTIHLVGSDAIVP